MIPDGITSRLATAVGNRCWHVGAGGHVGSSFSLALGERIRRDRPLRHAPESDKSRLFEGEFRFLVWCSWRLEGRDGPVTSSDQEQENLVKGLQLIEGNTLVEAVASPPAWDLCLTFSGALRLVVFCDHLRGDASIEQNWEFWHRGEALLVGPGYEWQVYRERE